MSGFLKLWSLLTKVNKESLGQIVPIGFSALFILLNLASSIFESIRLVTIQPFVHSLSTSLLALDYGIWEQVNIAITDSSNFGLINVFIILSALGVLIIFIRAVEKLVAYLMNDANRTGLGSTLIAIFILGLVEFVAVLATHQKLVFPGQGMFALIFNMPQMFDVLKINWQTTMDFLYENV